MEHCLSRWNHSPSTWVESLHISPWLIYFYYFIWWDGSFLPPPIRILKLQALCKILIGTAGCDLKSSVFDDLPLSSSAATGPNPQAGRPRRGPGAPRRDLPMDGTWALIERGVTATSSKCPVFKETGGGGFLCPRCFRCFANLWLFQPRHCLHTVSICAFGILILCSLCCCAHSAPASSHSLSHSCTPTILLVLPPKRKARAFESVCTPQMMKTSTCVGTLLWSEGPAPSSEDAGL